MPTYSFHCESCEHLFEQVMQRGSTELPPCPECRGSTRKIIKPPMIHFRGSGFYKTDSAPSSKPTTKTLAAPEAKKPETAPVSPSKSETAKTPSPDKKP